MASFFTRTSHGTAIDLPNDCGERIVTRYRRKCTEDGCMRLVEDGTEDIYAPIQAAADPGGVYAIIDAYVRTGDKSILEVQRGAYIDVTSHPTTLAGLEQLRIDSRERFNSLPLDIRNLFHNNPAEFIANSGRALEAMAALGKKTPGSGEKTPAAEQAKTGAAADGSADHNRGGDN